MTLPQTWSTRLALIAVAVTVVITSLTLLGGGPETKTVTAHISRAVSIYVGSEVRILGVNVGTVTAVVPEGRSVRVEMEYDAEYPVPADAKAVIVTPTLVADRFVQLAPVWREGDPLLADGADIALPDTGTPVELDRIYASLQDLSQALGPNGANRHGSLDTLLEAGAKALDGQGETGHQMILDMSTAAEVFGRRSGDLFATVRNLDAVTATLAENDKVVDGFMQELGGAADLLADERRNLARALKALARALGRVRGFVKTHRGDVTAEIRDLTEVLDVMVKNKDSLATALEKGPLGLGNLALAFDTTTGSIGSRVQIKPNVASLDNFLCSIVRHAQLPAAQQACGLFKQILEPIGTQVLNGEGPTPPAPDGSVPGSSVPAQSLGQLLGARR